MEYARLCDEIYKYVPTRHFHERYVREKAKLDINIADNYPRARSNFCLP